MRLFNRLYVAAALVAATGAVSSNRATAAPIFDDSATAGNATHQVPGANGADYGPGATITVSANTPITSFTLETYQQNGGNLKFFVYDETTGTFPVITAPVAFGTAYFNYAQSPQFSTTLLQGHTYDLGAVSDSDTYYAYGYTNDGNGTAPVTQNGITGPIRNILVGNYANPTPKVSSSNTDFGSPQYPGSAQFALQIYDNVPEPTCVALLAVAGVGLLGRRRYHAKA